MSTPASTPRRRPYAAPTIAPASSADICRALGVAPGDRVTDGVLTLTVTAVGEERILARNNAGLEVALGLGQGLWRKVYECATCGADCDATVGIHRDGLGEGPEGPLCDPCGGSAEPSCEHLWAAIRARRVAAGEAVAS